MHKKLKKWVLRLSFTSKVASQNGQEQINRLRLLKKNRLPFSAIGVRTSVARKANCVENNTVMGYVSARKGAAVYFVKQSSTSCQTNVIDEVTPT